MIAARRLKRNFKRFLLPFETALYWVAGPIALALYGLFHGVLQGARLASTFLTHWRL